MKPKKRTSWTYWLWMVFLLALLAAGVYVLLNASTWTPQTVKEALPALEDLLA